MRAALSLVALAALAALSSAAFGQTAVQRVSEARALAAACRVDEALPAAEAALAAARDEFGAQSAEAGYAADDVAKAAMALGRFNRALASGAEAASIVGAARGVTSLDYAVVRGNQGAALMLAGRFGEAHEILSEADHIAEAAAPTSERRLPILAALQDAEQALGDSQAARAAAERALGLARQIGPPNGPLVTAATIKLADARRGAGDAAGAQALLASLPVSARAEPRVLFASAQVAMDRVDLVETLSLLHQINVSQQSGCDLLLSASVEMARGNAHLLRREAPEARAAFTRALSVYDTHGFAQPHRLAQVYHGLAIAARFNGAQAESAALFDRAASLFGEAYGANSPERARTLSEKAMMLADGGDASGALEAARTAESVLDSAPTASARDRANARSALGFAALRAGDDNGAASSFEQAVAAFEQASGPQSYDLSPGLTELGAIALRRRDAGRADALLSRALDIQRRDGALTGLAAGRTQSLLGRVAWERGDIARALQLSGGAVDVLEARLELRPSVDSARDLEELRLSRAVLETDLELAFAARGRALSDEALAARVFRVAQLAAMTRTAQALTQMAERHWPGRDALSGLLRQRQDLVREWQALDARTSALLAANESAAQGRVDLNRRAQSALSQIAAIDTRIAAQFPEYRPLLAQSAAGLVDTQALLAPDEALLVFVLGETQSWCVVVTRERAQALSLSMSADQAAALTRTMREGLEIDAWRSLEQPPPFRVDAAYALYQGLFAQAEVIAGDKRHWLVAPDRALASVPLGALLRAPSQPAYTPEQYRALPWLASPQRAILVLPSASSLLALRRTSNASGDAPFFGIGDPQLAPPGGTVRGIRVRPIAAGEPRESSELSRIPSLPETRAELESIAASLGADQSSLLLGAQATETQLFARDLSRYRIVAFATHGVLSGELPGRAEPGLILTPPRRASADDDGYLAASEIAALRMDADLVILSACNTAAADGTPDGEGFSGLSRAFLFAGARGVLATHWRVDSEATMLFTTAAARGRASGLSIADAANQAQIGLRDYSGFRWSAHPGFWAAFVYVGA